MSGRNVFLYLLDVPLSVGHSTAQGTEHDPIDDKQKKQKRDNLDD